MFDQIEKCTMKLQRSEFLKAYYHIAVLREMTTHQYTF